MVSTVRWCKSFKVGWILPSQGFKPHLAEIFGILKYEYLPQFLELGAPLWTIFISHEYIFKPMQQEKKHYKFEEKKIG
jgi:hypothetical protein